MTQHPHLHDFARTPRIAQTQNTQPALGGLAGWLIRLFKQSTRKSEHTPQLVLLEQLSLGANARLALVQCGGQTFLAGCGTTGVQTITPVNAPAPNTVSSYPSHFAGGRR